MADGGMIVGLIVMAFFPVGLKVISEQGMILGAFGGLMDSVVAKLPPWARKPLWTCERCMCGLWGIPAAAVAVYAPLWVALPVLLVTAIGIQDLMDA